MHRETTHRTPRRTRSTLASAELRRLDHDLVALEAQASTDPVLATMLAAARACRAQLVRDTEG